MNVFMALGSVNAFVAIILGAITTFGWGDEMPAVLATSWQRAVDSQLYHALTLLVIALCIKLWPRARKVRTAGLFHLLGILFYSGSLYLLVLTGFEPLSLLPPLGAMFFLCGWLLLLISVRDFEH